MEEGIASSSYPHRRKFREQCDRFIPFRSAMDFDYASTVFTTGKKGKKKPSSVEIYSPSREAYRKLLVETFNMDRRTRRILVFKNKQPDPVKVIPAEFLSPPSYQFKAPRHIPRLAPEMQLDASDLVDDYCSNLLDWGSSNVLCIALGCTVYLWDASDRTTAELVTADEEIGPVTSVKWAPDGRLIAVGLNNSHVQLWDTTVSKLIRTWRGKHGCGVGALDWNHHILTRGGMDGQIINSDVRVRSHVETYKGHHQEVCGLKWAASGQHLASGGNDNLVHIWDRSVASRSAPRKWLHRLEDHTAAVRALAWCPFQSRLLASGGGEGDGCIKFWNTRDGSCLNSIDTGSEVCSLLWNKNERELLSSHGFSRNQLTLWKYPSMGKIAEIAGHTRRVLFIAESPNECTVASAAGDEILKFWNVFGTPEAAKPAPKTNTVRFAHLNRGSIR